MEIVQLTSYNFGDWDTFVEESPQGSIYCYSWYLKALRVKFKIIVIIENGVFLAGIVLPKNELNLYSNPLLFKYGGVLFNSQFHQDTYKNETRRRRVLEALIDSDFLKKKHSFNYTFHPNFSDYILFSFKNFKATPNYTYIINLRNKDINDILSNYYSRLRSKYNKAKRCDYNLDKQVTYNELWSMLEFTFKKQGSKPPFNRNNLKYFISQLLEMKRANIIGVRSPEGELMCAGLLYYDSKTAYLPINGVSSAALAGANEFLITEMIKLSLDKRLLYFDFEGSMMRPIESFYRMFGGDRIQYLKIYRPNLLNSSFEFLKRSYKKIKFGK